MAKAKSAGLSGLALVWAVSGAVTKSSPYVEFDEAKQEYFVSINGKRINWLSDAESGSDVLAQNKVLVSTHGGAGWVGVSTIESTGMACTCAGATMLEAGLRTLATRLLGDETDVPALLLPYAEQLRVISDAGYTIQSHYVGTAMEGWWVLLPGETEFKESEGGNHNYIGFFSNERDLLDEVVSMLDT